MNQSQPPRRPRAIAVIVVALVIAAVVVVVVVVMVNRSGDEPGPGPDGQANAATTTADPSGSTEAPETTAEQRDQREDVEVLDCTAEGGPKVTVTNKSDEPSRFLVVVEIEDKDGNSAGSAGGVVEVIQPGEKADATLKSAVAIPEGAICRVSQLVRTPV